MLFSFYLFLLVPALLLFLKFMSTFPQVRIFGSCDIVTDYVAFFPPQLFPIYKVRNVKGLLKFKGLLPICNTSSQNVVSFMIENLYSLGCINEGHKLLTSYQENRVEI